MQAAEKHRHELEELKQSRIQHIIECSYKLFAEKGIESITMNEIAAASEIGVASLYRYFSTKEELAIDCAVLAWREEADFFESYLAATDYDDMSGFEQVRALLAAFPVLYKKDSMFFRFVYSFDAFIKQQSVQTQRLERYEREIVQVQGMVMRAIAKGRADGTITQRVLEPGGHKMTDTELYFTVTHTLFSLAQKLSLSSEMLVMDRDVSAERQIELLIAIVLEAIR